MFLTVPFASSSVPSQTIEPLMGLGFFIPFLIFGGIMLGGFVFIIYGIVATILVFQGKPFRYVIIGNRIERFMQPK
jgi:ABC-type transport system involved in multi-copper enzyme maturation permease subunit